MALKTLLIDNYDSYTYNLFQLISEVNGGERCQSPPPPAISYFVHQPRTQQPSTCNRAEPPQVVRNDETTVEAILQQIDSGLVHNIVISPGPGTPATPSDVGLCLPLLQAQPCIPILGVCLGMQALALAHGGRVMAAPEPVHGRLSGVRHAGHALFHNIPSGQQYQVVRYHSLVIDESSLPEVLESIAWTHGAAHHALGPEENLNSEHLHTHTSAANGFAHSESNGSTTGGVLMGVAHRTMPHYGVQYHPESVGTAFGAQLFMNFRDLTLDFHGMERAGHAVPRASPLHLPAQFCAESQTNEAPREHKSEATLGVVFEEASGVLDSLPGGAQMLFERLFLRSNVEGARSACKEPDTFWLDSSATDRARFSFMGGRGGPLWRRITYDLPEQPGCPGVVRTVDASGAVLEEERFFWEWLAAQLQRWQCEIEPRAAACLPFDFWGGLVGYLGYELKAECGGVAAHRAPTPDVAYFLADRLVAVDHHTGAVYAVALFERGIGEHATAAQAWVSRTLEAVKQLTSADRPANGHIHTNGAAREATTPVFSLREPRQQYLHNVASCIQALYAGESYELCLTTALRSNVSPDPWRLYSTLRAVNPAPYAAWLDFGADGGPIICCSSPERFLRGDRAGWLEAKPIKGTAPRNAWVSPEEDAAAAAALECSEKDRAENLMIVDLLRNDLGRVCVPGSVHVPSLMKVESFATVHQLVSTVRGLRRQGASVTDAIRAAFPGGSMTGAPKVRSMAILDSLEGGPRGVYSGAAGFIGFNGTFDLNIVIRTAVVHQGGMTIGAGGAIVVQSNPEGEFDEMKLKAAALLRAVGQSMGTAPANLKGEDQERTEA